MCTCTLQVLYRLYFLTNSLHSLLYTQVKHHSGLLLYPDVCGLFHSKHSLSPETVVNLLCVYLYTKGTQKWNWTKYLKP